MLREKTIETLSGHLELADDGYWNGSAKTPKDALLGDSPGLERAILQNPHVRYIAGRLNFYGLVSAGEKSLSARGVSVDPVVQKFNNQTLKMLEGQGLAPEKPFQVLLGAGRSSAQKWANRSRS